jgi:hypothetical protein
MMDDALTYIETTYIPRKIEIRRSACSGKNTSIHIFTDPRKGLQTISGQDLHRFRLTYAFTKEHDFRLSPAA